MLARLSRWESRLLSCRLSRGHRQIFRKDANDQFNAASDTEFAVEPLEMGVDRVRRDS